MGSSAVARTALLAVLLSTPFARAAPPTATASKQALELFEQSATDYREGRFQDAIDKLQAARELKQEPVLLYNLARAYEGLGRWEEAANTYRQYLIEEPAARDRKAIEARVLTIDAQVAELTGARKAQAATARSPEAPAPADTSSKPGPTPWIVAGVGLALLGTGATLGVIANAKHDAAVDEPVQTRAVAFQDSAETFGTVATVVTIAGAVLALGGATWAIVRSPRATNAHATRNYASFTSWTFP